ncbi:hypothetical protein DENIS_0806 [Desulfonema ishimotonii]|uniref:Stress response protein n=1 Tax=Desulfonema ishimotonii TaxID=45657 RepID=A0A401FSC7_9BACT|nr:stress response protein [Desulfonema ishimotonii]GBC59865.1 hypothetical protein DENIS_0806 [Desulfonema ishimotonii]
MELKQKGANAVLGEFKQLKVDLVWTAAVDLDLMAFYRTRDGRSGGIYSENYTGGSHGDLNAFPFIQLSGDAGVGAASGDNRETLRIVRLDDFEALYICAVNFTDASAGTGNVFADYDARVEVATDKGERHTVALDSAQTGAVAVLCKFEGGFMGTSLVNDSQVMDFKAFQSTVPGASALKLSSKVVLKQKGEKASLACKSFDAVMRWRTSVDLDLHCFYRLKPDAPKPARGFLGKIFKGQPTAEGHISFMNFGNKTDSPWIFLDRDAGVGDRGGDNEENIHFTRVDQIEHALIVANIFNKPNANFASYDGVVVVRGGSREIEVPLSESQPGSWCVIARLDNSGATPQLINVNQTRKDEPVLSDFL